MGVRGGGAIRWLCALVFGALLPACYLTHGPEGRDEAPVPEVAPLLHPQLARGSFHACVLLDDGSVHCWGSNTFGQLGAPEVVGEALLPVRVEGLPLIQQISASSAQTCALDVFGHVHCWGMNEQGQLGVGLEAAPDECMGHGVDASGSASNDCARAPVEVPGLEQVIQVSAGGTHACALRADRRVLCWGWLTGALDRSASRGVLAAPDASTVRGDNYIQATPVLMQGVSAAQRIAAGSSSNGPGHSCAVLVDGGLQCWGNQFYGQTGPVDTGLDPIVPLPIERTRFALAGSAVDVAAGSAHSCAVTTEGEVFCWGSNSRRELGVDTGYRDCDDDGPTCVPGSRDTWRITTPVRVEGISDAVAVAIQDPGFREPQTCALLRDATVACWQNGARWTVPDLADVVELNGNCATVRDGNVLCWDDDAAPSIVPEVRLAYADSTP